MEKNRMSSTIDWLLGRKKLRQERDQFESLLGECQKRSIVLSAKREMLELDHKELQLNLLHAASNITQEREDRRKERNRCNAEKSRLRTEIAFNKIEIDTLKAKLKSQDD